MRTPRQNKVDVAVMDAINNVAPFMLPLSLLVGEAARLAMPKPTVAEIDDALRYHETARRLTAVQGETERKFKLSDDGRAWLAENS